MSNRKKIRGWESLQPKQQALYEILLNSSNEDQVTLESMKEALGVKSHNTVVHHLKQLEKKGYIRRQGDFGQIEVLPEPVRDIVYLNLYGAVGCSTSGFFNDDNVIDRIPFPVRQMRVSPESFLVEARGESMEPLVHSKDLVLVDRSPISNGDIAVVVHDNEAKLKRVFKEKVGVVLQSMNPKYEPLVVKASSIRIVGVFRGVVRSSGRKNSLKIQKRRR